MSHTRAPWRWEQRAHTKGPPSSAPEDSHLDYFHISAGEVGGDGWQISGFMRPEDAPLIAAAPELLAALKELLASWMTAMPPFEKGKDAQDAWADRRAKALDDARAVIAKADASRLTVNIVTREIWPGMWQAIDEDTYDGAPDSPTRYQVGLGITPEKAIADLRKECEQEEVP